MIDLEEQLTEHLRSRASVVTPHYDLEAVEQGIRSVALVHRDDRRSRRPMIGVLVGAAAAIVGIVVVGLTLDRPSSVTQVDPATVVTSPAVETSPTFETGSTVVTSTPATSADPVSSEFAGSWTSTDNDGSIQTMEIRVAADGSASMLLRDEHASAACAGARASLAGAGRVDTGGVLVIVISTLTCDDGGEPAVSASSLDEYTLTHDVVSDTLTDSNGVPWRKEGTVDPNAAPVLSGTMWPQSSLEEIQAVQELADAGDPAAAWQLEPELRSDEWWAHLRSPGAEIVERFILEELGWDGFLFNPYRGDDGDGAADGVIRGVIYLRCGPEATNPLYPTAPEGHQEAPGAESCAPTIDEYQYESVSLDLSQPDRQGPDGIWAVSGWATAAPFTQTDPTIAEADATARLEGFLTARVAGVGAEGFVEASGGQGLSSLLEVPLLYATTGGSRYERFEIERVRGPIWPYGETEFLVRLFADAGETVVEQPIHSTSFGGGLELTSRAMETTENGRPVAVPYTFFEGAVSVSAPDPWDVSPFFPVALTLDDQSGDERLEFDLDPLPVATGCEAGPVPADAAGLVRSLQSDPDLETTALVNVSIGGLDALQIDITLATTASVCPSHGSPHVLTPDDDGDWGGTALDRGSRMRLFLLDLPDGSASRILAIAMVAPEARFDEVLEAATPIIESIDFPTS